jgi:hypothetical protein
MIHFRYDFTPQEWHEWNNQPQIQEWRSEIAKEQSKRMKRNNEVYIKEFSHGFMRTFVRKVSDACAN